MLLIILILSFELRRLGGRIERDKFRLFIIYYLKSLWNSNSNSNSNSSGFWVISRFGDGKVRFLNLWLSSFYIKKFTVLVKKLHWVLIILAAGSTPPPPQVFFSGTWALIFDSF